jgi:hypothetical protein
VCAKSAASALWVWPEVLICMLVSWLMNIALGFLCCARALTVILYGFKRLRGVNQNRRTIWVNSVLKNVPSPRWCNSAGLRWTSFVRKTTMAWLQQQQQLILR